MRESDLAYIAGLFDGEGSITYKQYNETKKNRDGSPRKTLTWRIVMEISMTNQSVLRWVCEVLGCGTVRPKKVPKGCQKQWRWRASFRDAYYICCAIYPYVHVKYEKVTSIIKHYNQLEKRKGYGEVVDLDHYRFWHKKNEKERQI